MQSEEIIKETKQENPNKNRVHRVLAHSYLFYFLLFLIGLLLDFWFPVRIFQNNIILLIGVLFLLLGTFLVAWAQTTSRNLQKGNTNKEIFYRGPYRYTRSPTHFGLFFLTIGFGIIANSLFITIFSILSFFITKFIFIKEEEKILAEKYGDPYLEYRKSVKF